MVEECQDDLQTPNASCRSGLVQDYEEPYMSFSSRYSNDDG